MADGMSTANANLMLNAGVGTNANDVELHIGAPGSAGTANPSSVTTRQSVTWAAASGASVAASNQPAYASWSGTNGETVTDLAMWSAGVAGTFGFSMPLSAPVTMHTGDSLTLTSLTVAVPTAS